MDDVQIQAPEVLATPAAESPAAGICAEFSESQVLVTINPDIPDPRCTKIQPSQKLVVENRRQENLRVQIGPFDVLISPGGRHLFDLPFGDYLAPGVHQMIVSPCCGAELWLEIP